MNNVQQRSFKNKISMQCTYYLRKPILYRSITFKMVIKSKQYKILNVVGYTGCELHADRISQLQGLGIWVSEFSCTDCTIYNVASMKLGAASSSGAATPWRTVAASCFPMHPRLPWISLVRAASPFPLFPPLRPFPPRVGTPLHITPRPAGFRT